MKCSVLKRLSLAGLPLLLSWSLSVPANADALAKAPSSCQQMIQELKAQKRIAGDEIPKTYAEIQKLAQKTASDEDAGHFTGAERCQMDMLATILDDEPGVSQAQVGTIQTKGRKVVRTLPTDHHPESTSDSAR